MGQDPSLFRLHLHVHWLRSMNSFFCDSMETLRWNNLQPSIQNWWCVNEQAGGPPNTPHPFPYQNADFNYCSTGTKTFANWICHQWNPDLQRNVCYGCEGGAVECWSKGEIWVLLKCSLPICKYLLFHIITLQSSHNWSCMNWSKREEMRNTTAAVPQND